MRRFFGVLGQRDRASICCGPTGAAAFFGDSRRRKLGASGGLRAADNDRRGGRREAFEKARVAGRGCAGLSVDGPQDGPRRGLR